MKTIKIDFLKMYGGFFKHDNIITNTLNMEYNVVIDPQDPDIVICQHFPGEPAAYFTNHLRKRCKVVHWFLESLSNIGPINTADYDYSFSSCKMDTKNNIRIPLWSLYIDWFDNQYIENRNQAFLCSPEKLIGPREFEEKTNFCCILTNTAKQRHNRCIREKFYPYFMEYFGKRDIFVESRGRFLQNMPSIGGNEKHKLEYIKDFKFNLCFDNGNDDGWITEKIIHPIYEGVIPIYWGCADVGDEFNIDAFIHARDFKTPEDLCEEVLRVHNNPSVFKEIQKQPCFPENKIPEHVKPEFLLEELKRLLEL